MQRFEVRFWVLGRVSRRLWVGRGGLMRSSQWQILKGWVVRWGGGNVFWI